MIKILEHPLLLNDLRILRDKNTSTELFRGAVNRISLHLAIAVSEEFLISEVEIETPMETTTAYQIEEKVILLPVIRAGLGLLTPFQMIMPHSSTGYIGLKRNEITFQAEEYYYSMPKSDENTTVVILEVMLATGGSVTNTISRLLLEGVSKIIVASIISTPEGIERILTEFPKVKIYSAALDRELDINKYILPGLGDAGDRMNGSF